MQLSQPRIETALIDQFGMRTGFHNLTLIQNDDAVRLQHGGEPVGDNKGVRPCRKVSKASCTARSLSESSADVASSSSRIGASRRIARAMAILCLCPPDSVAPRSPISVS